MTPLKTKVILNLTATIFWSRSGSARKHWALATLNKAWQNYPAQERDQISAEWWTEQFHKSIQ